MGETLPLARMPNTMNHRRILLLPITMFGQKYPHRIRLRGPWDFRPLTRKLPCPAPGRLTFPFSRHDDALRGCTGNVLLHRRFGYPGKIDPDERVWLTLAALPVGSEIRLNELLLGRMPGEMAEYLVGPHLLPRNSLEIVLDLDTGVSSGDSWGQVALEIRRAAFLRDVHLTRPTENLSVRGLLVGETDHPLELYCLTDVEQVHYLQLQPTTQGTPFELPIHPEFFPTRTIRLELVDVSSVWYAIRMPVPDFSAGTVPPLPENRSET